MIINVNKSQNSIFSTFKATQGGFLVSVKQIFSGEADISDFTYFAGTLF